jgi:hypothetical protein
MTDIPASTDEALTRLDMPLLDIVPLGWPRGRCGPTTRRPVQNVTHLDGYGNRARLDKSHR